MNLYNLLQIAVVSGAVAFSAFQLMRKLLPDLVHDWRVKGSLWLNRESLPVPVQKLGRSIQPVEAPAEGCGSGCSTCNACANIAANLAIQIPAKD